MFPQIMPSCAVDRAVFGGDDLIVIVVFKLLKSWLFDIPAAASSRRRYRSPTEFATPNTPVFDMVLHSRLLCPPAATNAG